MTQARQSQTTSKLLLLAALAGAMAFCVPYAPASAEQTTIEVQLNNQNALVFVTTGNGTSPTGAGNRIKTFSAVTRIKGPVNKLLQLRIYVNNVFTATVPLTPSMTDFTYDLALPPGVHTITIEGVSANESPDPSYTFTVEYLPTASGSSDEPTPEQAPNPSTDNITTDTTVATPTPRNEVTVQLPPWLYTTLISLDVISPAQATSPIKIGFWRPLLLVLGVAALTLAPWLLRGYRHVRYTVLGWHGKPLPALIRNYPLVWIRLTGIVLLIGSLLFI